MRHVFGRLISALFVTYFKLRYWGRISFGKGIIMSHRFKLYGPGHLELGDGVNLWAHEEPNKFHFYSKDARIKVGKNTRLNGLTAHCCESIEIGEDALIGSATLIETDFHTFEDPSHILYGKAKSKPIKIGNGVWLCGQCAVLKGCEIGDKSVVAFRAVVTKSFPANTLIAGNPATQR